MSYVGYCPWARFTHKAVKHEEDEEAYLRRWDSPLIAPWPFRFAG
jgi:hypothetical protein